MILQLNTEYFTKTHERVYNILQYNINAPISFDIVWLVLSILRSVSRVSYAGPVALGE